MAGRQRFCLNSVYISDPAGSEHNFMNFQKILFSVFYCVLFMVATLIRVPVK